MPRFPDPPKPPLPPPPLPPLSSLMSLENRLKNSHNNNRLLLVAPPAHAEREQLIYSRFLQNFIFKYNNRNVHKLCAKIDMSNLEYLILNHENLIMAANKTNRFGSVSMPPAGNNSDNMIGRVDFSRIGAGLTLPAKQSSMNVISSNLSRIITTTTTTTTTMTSSTTSHNKQFETSFVRNTSSLVDELNLFDFDEYFNGLSNKFNSDPLRFFFDTLLVPLVVVLVFFLLVMIGVFIKSCRKSKKSSSAAATSSSSSTSFIACYGTNSLGSTSVENSIGNNSTLLLTTNLISSSPTTTAPITKTYLTTKKNHQHKYLDNSNVYYSEAAIIEDEQLKKPIRELQISNNTETMTTSPGLSRQDEEDDSSSEDQSSSGKYYSIKSNNNYNSKQQAAEIIYPSVLFTSPPPLSTFGRHHQQPRNTVKTSLKNNGNLILNIANFRNTETVKTTTNSFGNSLANSSTHSVDESNSSLTRSSNHYNEPDVYFTSSFSKLVNTFEPPTTAKTANNLMNSSSKVFPRTNPMYRNHGGGSAHKLNQSSFNEIGADVTIVTNLNNTITNTNVSRNEYEINVCSKL